MPRGRPAKQTYEEIVAEEEEFEKPAPKPAIKKNGPEPSTYTLMYSLDESNFRSAVFHGDGFRVDVSDYERNGLFDVVASLEMSFTKPQVFHNLVGLRRVLAVLKILDVSPNSGWIPAEEE